MAVGSDEYKKTIRKFLEDNTTKKYFIEYGGYLSNHVSHGLRALQKLGAPLSRIEKFLELQQQKFEPATKYKEEEEPMTGLPDSLMGKKVSFYKLYDYYEQLLENKYSGSLDDLLAHEFPKLSGGMVGSAFHGMIHLGYGYESGLPWFVCEGLAYLHFGNLRLNMSAAAPTLCTFGSGDADILDVLEEIRNDDSLRSYMLDEESKMKRSTSHFGKRANSLFSGRADILLQYAHKVKFPVHIKPDTFTLDQIPELAKWLVDYAVIVYVIAEPPNDFFLIHGVTSSWALKNILHSLKNVNHVMDATRTFLCSLFTAYLAQNSPRLNADVLSNNKGADYTWSYLIQKTLHHVQVEEEHFYKLVQVCKCMSDENNDIAMEAIYKLAANNCISNELTFE